MSFIADKQTLEDLNLVGRFKSNSIFRLFDKTITNGGRQLMDQLFREPLINAGSINERVRVFQYFSRKEVTLPFANEAFGAMENYLRGGSGSLLSSCWSVLAKKGRSVVTGTNEYRELEAGCVNTIQVLQQLHAFVLQLLQDEDNPFAKQLDQMKQVFAGSKMQWLAGEHSSSGLSLVKLVRYDHCLRGAMQSEMKMLMQMVYQIDVNIAVAGVAKDKGFCYPHALEPHMNSMHISELFHPLLSKPVTNQAHFASNNNVLFLTGANMAGKSTYMKSVGIAVYLAHMGFPVAAEQMEFSVKKGLFSSINVPDNIEHGYSHFYAEVLRVKKVAEAVDAGNDLIVLFDELFKGTNVKDAFEATLSITKAFSGHRNCFFIISTHIIEVGEALKVNAENIRFEYMPTIMKGKTPTYTYQLKDGITQDRQGMMIIENEGILELLKQMPVSKG